LGAVANYLAIDLGASSGRAVLGAFDGRKLSLREMSRFPNGPLSLPTGLHWDTPQLFEHVRHVLGACGREKIRLSGVGIDTWGVDYGLMSSAGELLGLPHHYRDPRTRDMMAVAFGRVPKEEIYRRSGIQFMTLNTVYQLLAERQAADGRLDAAHTLLFTPDLLNYWLTGIKRSERSIASTSQMYDPGAGNWAADLVERLGLPARILPEVAPSGTAVGTLFPAIGDETGVGPVTVIAPASHDTGSAVAAVPATGDGWAYISSGTWSLVGRELKAPICTAAAEAANFTNECGVAGTIRFHKNVAGLWLLQECHRVWAAQGREHSFDDLIAMGTAAPPLAAMIDPDDPSLSEFGDMPRRIRALCERAGQRPPSGNGEMVRCILESLALKYRVVLDSLEELTGPVSTIHIVGGGVRNTLLCQFAADATGRRVVAGPVEATAAGNAMVQAMACGQVSGLEQIRSVIAASFELKVYEPTRSAVWTEAVGRFRRLIASGGDATGPARPRR